MPHKRKLGRLSLLRPRVRDTSEQNPTAKRFRRNWRRAAPSRNGAAQRNEQEREAGKREQTPVELIGRWTKRGERHARAVVRHGRGLRRSGLRDHLRLRFDGGLRLHDGLRLRGRRLHRLRADDRRCAMDDRSGCDRRRRAVHRCGLRPGHRRRLGSDGVRRWIRGRSRRPCRHGENDAQHRESSHRSPPAPQQRPSSLSCHIPPISRPFLEATAVLGVCQRGFTPRRPAGSRSAGRRLLSFRA